MIRPPRRPLRRLWLRRPARASAPAVLAALTAALAHSGAAADFDVSETSIAATQAAISEHRVSCHQVIEQYLTRIRDLDQPLRVNAMVLVNPDALAAADRTDREFAQSQRLPRLGCIGVIVKDNYDTADLQTTGGSLAMKGFVPHTDAFMVARIRAAGAIILGKANMAEWAFNPYLTASSIAGITRNPYNRDYVPAGSSGGTAAAVAASFGAVGLGTDTGNSIRGPSSHSALVGIRPSIGLTSRDGIIPLLLSQDVGGPMARSVADAAIMLDVLAGTDPADPATHDATLRMPKTYTAFLDPHGLKGARIGVFRQYLDAPTGDPAIKALSLQAIAALRAQGARIVDPFVVPDFDAITQDIWCGDFQTDVDAWFKAHGEGAPYRNIAAIVASGLYLPYIEERLKAAVAPAAAGDRKDCNDPLQAAKKTRLRDALLAAMKKDNVDAIIYPTWSNAPRKVGDTDSPPGDNSQILSPETGFPAITVPMGYSHDDLPAGLTFLGRAFDEGRLIKYAYGFEQATHHRHPPQLQ